MGRMTGSDHDQKKKTFPNRNDDNQEDACVPDHNIQSQEGLDTANTNTADASETSQSTHTTRLQNRLAEKLRQADERTNQTTVNPTDTSSLASAAPASTRTPAPTTSTNDSNSRQNRLEAKFNQQQASGSTSNEADNDCNTLRPLATPTSTQDETLVETKRRLAGRGNNTKTSTTNAPSDDTSTVVSGHATTTGQGRVLDEKQRLRTRVGRPKEDSTPKTKAAVSTASRIRKDESILAEKHRLAVGGAAQRADLDGKKAARRSSPKNQLRATPSVTESDIVPGAVAIDGPEPLPPIGRDLSWYEPASENVEAAQSVDAGDDDPSLESGLVVLEGTKVETHTIQAQVARQVPKVQAEAEFSRKYIILGLIVTAVVAAVVVWAVVLPDRSSPSPTVTKSPTAAPTTLSPTDVPTPLPTSAPGLPFTSRLELIDAINSCKLRHAD